MFTYLHSQDKGRRAIDGKAEHSGRCDKKWKREEDFRLGREEEKKPGTLDNHLIKLCF